MVKSVLGVKHQGLSDWSIQRISAIYMAVFTLLFVGYIVSHPGLSFGEWHYLFLQTWMKVASIVFIGLMLLHAWVGIWTIFTDYVKPFVLRAILHALVLLSLFACFIWGVMILWSL